MQSISVLKGRHAGRPIAIMGGGPSLADDLKRIPRDAVKISVNQHALYITGADYVVTLDDPTGDPVAIKMFNRVKGALIGKAEGHVDYLFDVRFWYGQSGHSAAWVGCYMGGDPVLLCGMDLYQGPKMYCEEVEDPAGAIGLKNKPLKNHVNNWRSAFSKCPNAERIRAMSGPLVDVFGIY